MVSRSRDVSLSPVRQVRRTKELNDNSSRSRQQSVSPRKKRNVVIGEEGENVQQFLGISGDGIFPIFSSRSRSSNSGTRVGSSSPRKRRTLTSTEKERQERIDNENRILLRKILEQHHGIRRRSAIPPSRKSRNQSAPGSNRNQPGGTPVSNSKQKKMKHFNQTSNQINTIRERHKTDYENLLLLQKIQNVKPSREIATSFGKMRIK